MHFLNDTYKVKIFFLSTLLLCVSGKALSIADSLLNSTAIIRIFEPHKIINNSPNYSIVFDESGIMFLGQQDKISIYNGFSWSNVSVKGEILLARTSTNAIFFSGENNFGYLSPDSSQKFKAHYLTHLLPDNIKLFKKATAIIGIDKTIYLLADSVLFSYNSNGFKVLQKNISQGKIFNCGKKLISIVNDNHISVFQENVLKNSCVFSDSPINLILEHEVGYLVVTKGNKCIITDSLFVKTGEWPGFDSTRLSRGIKINSDEYIFTDENNTLIFCQKYGQINSGFNSKYKIPESKIISFIQESSGDIWILQEKSIFRIEYPSSIGLISSIPDHFGNIIDTRVFDNKIYAATTTGLYYIDAVTRKFIETEITGFCYRIIGTPNGLIAFSNEKVYLLNKNNCSLISSGKMLDHYWDEESQKLFIAENDKIKILSLSGNEIVDEESLTTPFSPLKICIIDSAMFFTNGTNLAVFNNILSSVYKPDNIVTPVNTEIIELFNWQNKLYLIAENEILTFSDGSVNFERSLSNEICGEEFISCIVDNGKNIWLLYRNQDKNYTVWFGNASEKSFTKNVLPSFIELDNPSFSYAGNNKIIMSDGTRIFHLDMNLYNSRTRKFQTIIKEIKAGNQSIFQGISYNLFRVPLRTALNNIPYNQNDIRIGLTTTDYFDHNIKYQYFLEGIDKIWSDWSSNQYIKFNNLREGQYYLKIRSKNYRDETSDVTSLIFRIKPPVYRSWWAYIIYAFALGVLVFIAYKSYLLNFLRTPPSINPDDIDHDSSDKIPVIINNTEPAANLKKFDFYSNIDETKERGQARWDKFELVTVLFSDIQGFTKIAESMNPELLIDELDRFFFHFDSVVEKYNIEKIKTIGDAYMAAGGIPKKSKSSPIEVVLAALEMQNYMKQLRKTKIDIWDLRIGIHSGPVIAGVIGHKKRSFDIWGDTVNTASRMESSGEAGKVNISSETYKLVKDYFICEYRGKLPVKYKGNIAMYFVKGLRPELSVNLIGLPNRKFFLKLQLLRLNDLEETVLSKLEVELNKNLFFHNFEYTKHLYEYSELLVKAADLDMEETLLVRTAALLLNTGFTGGYENQENRSAEYARNILPESDYSEKQIAIVSNLILSTKWPPEPMNMLEMVINDIKMEYIGRADYIRLYKLLFLEQNQFQRSVDVIEFKRKQLEIIQQYPFYTESAKRLREISQEDQLARINEDDWK